ncbi:MAG: SulP family inorganic anion transporter [Desulfobacteraceae bacterium]
METNTRIMSVIGRMLPFIEWLGKTRSATFKADAMAGLTVALVLIPQSMAYAQLAGLPAYYGLYASFLPPMAAALFGSSHQLATGPVAVVSLLTAVALEPLAQAGTSGYIGYAILLALMVGLFQFLLGIFRLGLLVNFLSHPVVNGFSNAAAIIIASSQLAKLFGVEVETDGYHYETLANVFRSALHHIHWPTLLMGLAAFAIMYALRILYPHSPSVLVAVVATTLIAWLTGFERKIEVPAAALSAPLAYALMIDYNTLVEEREILSKRRNRHFRRQVKAMERNDNLTAMQEKHQSQLVDYNIKRLESNARMLREKIRSFLLEGVAYAPDGISGFYPKGALPANAESDGRTWRIVVDRRPIDMEAVTLTAGGKVVGAIPRGLPGIAMPVLEIKAIGHLLIFSVIISLIGFMEAISVARVAAAQTGQRIDPNQELVGQGLANVFGAMTKGYPVSGSFSRTAVNLKAGAHSGLSSVVTSLVVAAMLLFFTPLFYHLPQSVLAAIIMMAVMGLINVNGFIHAWRAQWYDGAISIITFVCTLAFAPHLERGILIGVALSLGVFLYKSMRPTVVDLSLGVDRALHDAVSFGLAQCRYIDVVRFDGPLFFANASYMEEQIRDRRKSKRQLKHIIIVANGINDIDASGQEALSFIVDRVRRAGIDISLCGANESVMAALMRTQLAAKIGEDHFFPNMSSAVNTIHAQAHRGGDEPNCPLKTVVVASGYEREKEN